MLVPRENVFMKNAKRELKFFLDDTEIVALFRYGIYKFLIRKVFPIAELAVHELKTAL